ncbi:MAG TPA: flavodoxin domain-containing protein [Ruminiclostridium sp.]|nr:flavodoxin domain-containing protein [Ruminiclostridium sp.]
MKAVVVYKSKSGFAKKYAQWIAEELQADIYEASKISSSMLLLYDTIIYGGGLYAVGINGLKLITKNYEKLKDKRLVVFATGATPPRKEDIEKVRTANFTPEQKKYIRFFYLRGGFDYTRLKPIDKILMNLLKLKIKSKSREKLIPDERGMLAAYDKPIDFTRKKNIEELIAYVRS